VEPIAQFVRRCTGRCRQTWDQAGMNPGTKTAIMIAALCVLVFSVSVWLPVTVVLSVVYGIYWAIWSLVVAVNRGPAVRPWPPQAAVFTPAGAAIPPMPIMPPPPAPQPRAAPAWAVPGVVPWRQQALAHLQKRSRRERLAELVGSLLGSALAAIVLSFVAIVAVGGDLRAQPPQQYAWLLLTSIAGSWAVLMPAKLWEGKSGDPILRRFLMMVVGLGVGCLSLAAAQAFTVDGFPNPQNLDPPLVTFQNGATLAAFLASFTTLFVLIRWWRHTDPLRPSRLSLWFVIVTMVVAAVAGAFWQFPEPWLVAAAAVISISVQLASPWLNAHERFRRGRAAGGELR